MVSVVHRPVAKSLSSLSRILVFYVIRKGLLWHFYSSTDFYCNVPNLKNILVFLSRVNKVLFGSSRVTYTSTALKVSCSTLEENKISFISNGLYSCASSSFPCRNTTATCFCGPSSTERTNLHWLWVKKKSPTGTTGEWVCFHFTNRF